MAEKARSALVINVPFQHADRALYTIIQAVGAALQEDADRFLLRLAKVAKCRL